MATTIVTKNGSGAPAASDLVAGELAVDLTNGRLYTEDSGGSVIEIGLNPSGNVDVTGTVTADGAEIIGDVAINTTTPATYLHIVPTDGELNDAFTGFRISRSTSLKSAQHSTYSHSGGSATITSTVTTGGAGGGFRVLSSADGSTTKTLANFANNNDISFYEDTGTTAKLFWDASAESLGIGTSSPFFTAAGRSSLSVNGTSSSILAFGKGGSSENYILADAGGLTIANTSATLPTAFFNNGSTRMTISSAGSVGIGVTPKTTNATVTGSLNVNQAGLLVRNSNQAYFASNIYWDASDQLKSHGAGYGLASLFIPSDGSHRFFNTTAAATGADENLTLNETMRLDSSGHLLLGTGGSFGTLGTLVVQQTADSKGIAIVDSAEQNTLFIENQGDEIKFRGNSNSPMTFSYSTGEKMRIDSSGNLLVGKSVTTFGTAGIALRGTVADFTRDGGTPINVNRLTSDGSLIDFHKAGTVVGTIGVASGDNFYIGATAANHTGLQFADNVIVPMVALSNSDATTDLGASTVRFKDLYLSGGAYLGGTTAANKLEDYEEGLWTLTIATSGTGESVSIGNTTGTYTKIGRQVTATIYTSGVNVSAAGSGAVLLGGLPFTCSNGIQFYAVPSFGHTTLFSYEPDGYVTVNHNYITVTRVGTTTSNALSVGNPRYMMMTVTYFTDS